MYNDRSTITTIEWTEIYLLWSKLNQKPPQLTTMHQGKVEEIIKEIENKYSQDFNEKQELLKALLVAFLVYLSKNLEAGNPDVLHSREKQLVSRFMSLLEKNFAKNKMVNDYACQLYVSANYLNRTVKKITGFTASYHIQQHIVSEAKRQALHSSFSMKEIAYNLGFDNMAHFSKFFKNNAGMNFTCFKKSVAVQSV